MNQKPISMLIFGGIVIGTFAFFGYRSFSRHSDTDLQIEATREQQAATDVVTQTDLAALREQPLTAPSLCDSIRTGIFFDICQSQPVEGQLPLPWDIDLNDYEENCILEAFHATNRQVLALRQRDYLPEPPSDRRVIHFACDVVTAIFKEDSMLYENSDVSASAALETFYNERASTHYGPEVFY